MSSQIRSRLLAVGILLAAAALAWPTGAGAGLSAGTPQYPDVRTLPPYGLRLWQMPIDGQVHHQIRFSTLFANLGEGPLELHGSPHVPFDGLFAATQRIYESPAGFRDVPVGTFLYHPEHSHFHFDDFTRYELWTRREFERALHRGFAKGRPIAISDKVSFCMFDSEQVDFSLTVSPVPVYNGCTPFLEGISRGWADEYDWTFAGQEFDFGTSPPADGEYAIRTVADPSNHLWESEGKADAARESEVANQGYAHFSIVGGALVTAP